MNVHFIAIGGSAMHNLALELHKKGYQISGSDDEIFEPSRSRLQQAGLLPEAWGWFPEKITPALDAVILGMHARQDNPELLKARELGLRIFSYPEYLYEQTKDKKRVIVGGSHGKTTTTSMIMHVLKTCGIEFDYMAGALLEGFDTMVHLSRDSKIAVFEGDEYLSSPIDMRPKFHHYYPDIAILTGIAWDHMNVFPTFENYVEQFALFIEKIQPGGTLIYYGKDEHIQSITSRASRSVKLLPYDTFTHRTENGITYLTGGEEIPLKIFGEHNLQNISAAYLACKELGITDQEFMKGISTYQGAAKRLQKLAEKNQATVYLDFAHSPSKLKATIHAVRAQYPERKLIACMELHTFSSLNADFLPQYGNTMNEADKAIVFFNPEVVRHKQLPEIKPNDVRQGFNHPGLEVFTENGKLIELLQQQDYHNTVLLIMTSGNFSGINLQELAKQLVEN
jgi:UDP-N-acetylmuramate: L-alanyl-gamma-D-glutamyl-meso-diaminopimelate ligase